MSDQQGMMTVDTLLKLLGKKEFQLQAAVETIQVYEDHIRKMNQKRADKDKELHAAYAQIKELEQKYQEDIQKCCKNKKEE